MIEKIIQDYLIQNGFSCHLSIPEDPSGNFCVLEKTGSGCSNGLYSATLAVQSYGGSKLATAQLSHQVVQAMLEASTLPEISSCTLNNEYDFPDTTRKRPRYQAVFDVVYY